MAKSKFTFAISLSVLNQLGRNLYRSFATVLGEAISNSWDANADNVKIYVDRDSNSFIIKDDGDGMTANDFQNKFLKVGYSKRRGDHTTSPPPKSRPYIGRKGIGKLALLSCAKRITVISKTKRGNFVGGVIDNSGLDDAIRNDYTPSKYRLESVDMKILGRYVENHEHGTVVYFENMNEGIKNSLKHIRKIIALYFRFSLIDKSFTIFLDDDPITLDDLSDLADNTEFLWNINNLKDPYVTQKLKYAKPNARKETNLALPAMHLKMDKRVKGFIASVRKPSNLKITDTEERVGVDLFVNGRLRERDILRHIPTARLVENYLYGQIHFDSLDDDKDRFATGREGIVADDDKFKELLENLRRIQSEIIEQWDVLRTDEGEEGDPDNPRISKKERKAGELYNAVSKEYEKIGEIKAPEKGELIDTWVTDLRSDASYSFSSYAECFVSENLVRKHISHKKLGLTKEAKEEVDKWREKEKNNKEKGNVSIEIRKTPTDTSYLSMDFLANMVDQRTDLKRASLSWDAQEYKPIRDALMHTALLTEEAKSRLTSVSENIKGRVKGLLADETD